MFTSARPAQGSAAAMATVQVEWSASVMRDTMVGHKQHIIVKLLDTHTVLSHRYCSEEILKGEFLSKMMQVDKVTTKLNKIFV